jgi:glutamate decarboxylase
MLLGKQNNIPLNKLAEQPLEPPEAYRMVLDELLDEGNARQNLATFCQTYMEEEAVQLISKTLAKNAIDKSEYPRTAEIESRCVDIIADLWNVPESFKHLGTSTVGSSEACMLGGLAMKFRWRERAKAAGIDIKAQNPNLVISSGYQVCWEKFCVYWDIEMRAVPMNIEHQCLDIAKALELVDEYTIGVVGILGITYTGKYDDIATLDQRLTKYNETAKVKVPIHIDAASGGFYAPFVQPELAWDFRLENVVSINASGHKYGLVYPGIGWIVWKDEAYMPAELIFKVSYLGGEMPTMAINFSRSASQILAQYYNFVRFGREGYREIHEKTRAVAIFLTETVNETGLFEIINDGTALPLVCYRLKEGVAVEWTLYDLADRLQMRGWQVPAYPLPADLEDIIIQRYVIRADFSLNMAVAFAEDFRQAISELNQARILRPQEERKGAHGFTH